MTIKRRKFAQGIRLKGSTEATTLEGELRLDPASITFKAFVDGAERSIVTEDQAQTLTNKTIDADNNTISELETDNFKANVVDTDVTLAADSDTRIPSQKAIKAYVDTGLAGQNEASEIDYAPATSGDWNVVPTKVNGALDEAASRVEALEADSHTHANKAILDNITASYTTAEETKLAGIETAATADQTGAEIKAAYEAEADTNAFTDAEQTKLAAIEALADVTDATNVDAAGATMNTDSTLVGNSYFLDEDTLSSDDATKVPSQQSVKAYVDNVQLDNIADVSAAAPNSGEVLTYNSISGDWESKTPEGGLKNYITNGKAEADTTGWTVYANTAAGAVPDDFGGTPSGNLTFTRNTTDPLSGLADFKLSTTAANLQGEGVYYEFTLDKVDLATKLVGIIRKDSSDSGIADGDYRYYLASSSDAFASDVNIIRVNGEDLNGSSNDNIFQVQTDASDLTYRLCIHRAVVTATATNIYLDELELGPRTVSTGSAITDWKSDGPVIIGATTTAPTKGPTVTDEIRYRRVGDSLEVTIEYRQSSGGSSGSGDYLFKIPNGLKADTTKVKAYSNVEGSGTWLSDNHIGTFSAWSTANNLTGPVVLYDDSNVRFFGANSSLEGVVSSAFNPLGNSNILLNATYRVPILGWSSNSISSEDFGGRDISLEATFTTNQGVTANTEDIDFNDIIVKDTSSAWDGSGFTAKESGQYDVNGELSYTGTIIASHSIYVDGVQESRLSSNSGVSTHVLSGTVYLTKGQRLSIRTNDTATTNSGRISIIKRNSSQQILQTETVAARYTSDSGQAVTTVTTTDFIYEDVDYDTHGIYDSTTGIGTIPVGGLYRVMGKCEYDSGGTITARNSQFLVNGSIVLEEDHDDTFTQPSKVEDTIRLNKGDTFRFRYHNVGSGSLATTANSNKNTFSIVRIGD